ncbi:hypothetical protein CHS0354_000461 [Potamilus streckersoni]|uniref:Aminoacyl-transfer RNA synthetases class-II family profile domain-containing protein n=1 Tax=Potamilus streckersoni TaxID=2493646 RepID=A0AAE0T7D1_9BIVA|nr:hypothetical protein CHS0354_000461 [Potamilus streckersoni]
MNVEEIKKVADTIRDFSISFPEHLEEFKSRFLSRKGLFSVYFDRLKLVNVEERVELGRLLNELKEQAKEKYAHFAKLLSEEKNSTFEFDFTLPGSHLFNGTVHPVRNVLRDIQVIFERLGFEVKLGPEIEKDDYNFLKLNFEPNHPARDMQDTLYVKRSVELEDDVLLRTHTSSVQIRTMLTCEPPLRFIAPGKVYRNESVFITVPIDKVVSTR